MQTRRAGSGVGSDDDDSRHTGLRGATRVNLGTDTTLDYTFTLGYGLGMRTRAPSGNLLTPENINGDDGDRNFAKNKLIENQVSLLGEVNLKHDDWGVFVRADTFYDQAYQHSNYNDAPFTVNHGGTYNNFTEQANYWAGGRTQLLAAYVYNTFRLGGTSLNVKVGDQVVAWGESLFFPNIAGAQGPADATKSAIVAGAEVKDILLPVPQISAQWQLTPTFSLLGYYQFPSSRTGSERAGQLYELLGRGRSRRRIHHRTGRHTDSTRSRHSAGQRAASGGSAHAGAYSATPKSARTTCTTTT